MELYTFFIYCMAFSVSIFFMWVFEKNRIEKNIYWGSLGKEGVSSSIFENIIIGLPIIFLLSVRYGIGEDYFNYEYFFNYYSKWGISRFEPLAELLMKISLELFHDYQCFLAVVAFITVFLLVTWIRQLDEIANKELTTLIILITYVGPAFNIVYQTLAVSFAIFAFMQIERNHFIRFCIIVLISSLIHSSALIVFPCWFLVNHCPEKKMETSKKIMKTAAIIIIALSFAILYIYLGSRLNWAYTSYLGSTHEGGRINVYLRLSIFIYIPEIIFMKPILDQQREDELWYLLIAIEFVTFLVTLFVPYVFRMGMYFSCAHAILIPKIIGSIENRTNKIIVETYYVLLFIACFVFMTFICHFNGFDNYVSIFSK